jgi:hypothetical protein
VSGGAAFVMMMQPTDFSKLNDSTFVGSLCPSALWCVLHKVLEDFILTKKMSRDHHEDESAVVSDIVP